MYAPAYKDTSGRLTLWELPCFFAFSNGCTLKIMPESTVAEDFKEKCKERRGCFDSMDWIHGTDEWDRDIAFKPSEQQGPFSCHAGTLTLIVDIVLDTINHKGPDGEYLYKYEDLTGFNAIDFSGEAVNAIFSPKIAINRTNIDKNSIKWHDVSDFSMSFDSEINNVPCKLIFTVTIDRKDLKLDSIELGDLHAILRIEFSERQSISLIYECWQAVCYFLTFCVGQYNVTDLKIGLWNEDYSIGAYGDQGAIHCYINSEKEDNVVFSYPPYDRFQISTLGTKTGDLFKIICDKETRPILGFLNRSNTDKSVDRNKIRDLCTAFESEYEYYAAETPNKHISVLVDQLKEIVKTYRRENPNVLDDSTYGNIYSTLGFISLSARDKIIFIYTKYSSIIDANVKYMSLLYTVNLSEEQTKKDIGWFTKARNSITHATGITDTEIPNAIFFRLKIALFCSVLYRAGYTNDEISSVIKSYFEGEKHEQV